jgi:hypothetical protein
MTAKGLEKGLKASANQAAEDRTIDFHVTDSWSSLHLLGGRNSDETDLDALDRWLVCHAPSLRAHPVAEIRGITESEP